MSFYSRVIFPRLCDWVMSDPRMAKLRSEVLGDVGGEVLEIGFGTGLNLAHYPSGVRRITTADPDTGMSRLARKRIADSGSNSRWVERIPPRPLASAPWSSRPGKCPSTTPTYTTALSRTAPGRSALASPSVSSLPRPTRASAGPALS